MRLLFMNKIGRLWVWALLGVVLALVFIPEVFHSLDHYRFNKRIKMEREKVTMLIQAGDNGYEELVRLVPTLWFPNASEAIKGILAQHKRDRVADLCSAYVACGYNQSTKMQIARALGTLGDSRAVPVLLKDLQSVWGELELIRYDDQIDALGDLKARDATDLLLKIFRHQYSWEGSSWRTKMKVLIALGKIGNEQALPDASRNITSRSDWYVRQGALNYLIHIGNNEARMALQKAYQEFQDPEIALCLVQLGEMAVLPDLRNRLKGWLDNFDTGGWSKTDYWGVFYCVHALLITEDTTALPELRRAFAMFKKPNSEAERYIVEAAQGYTPRLLLNESKATSLISDLDAFLSKNRGVGN